jgi:hypothetical protein
MGQTPEQVDRADVFAAIASLSPIRKREILYLRRLVCMRHALQEPT